MGVQNCMTLFQLQKKIYILYIFGPYIGSQWSPMLFGSQRPSKYFSVPQKKASHAVLERYEGEYNNTNIFILGWISL